MDSLAEKCWRIFWRKTQKNGPLAEKCWPFFSGEKSGEWTVSKKMLKNFLEEKQVQRMDRWQKKTRKKDRVRTRQRGKTTKEETGKANH